jgi:NAD(P)-dependent dehydrogenase (short-subunit alcohol dehydrogenase family)
MPGLLMQGKRALVTGVANDRSIAWAIAQLFQKEGAELAFTYPGESMEKRVRPLAESVGAKAILDCDVSKDADIDRTVADLRTYWSTPSASRRAARWTGASPTSPPGRPGPSPWTSRPTRSSGWPGP